MLITRCYTAGCCLKCHASHLFPAHEWERGFWEIKCQITMTMHCHLFYYYIQQCISVIWKENEKLMIIASSKAQCTKLHRIYNIIKNSRQNKYFRNYSKLMTGSSRLYLRTMQYCSYKHISQSHVQLMWCYFPMKTKSYLILRDVWW